MQNNAKFIYFSYLRICSSQLSLSKEQQMEFEPVLVNWKLQPHRHRDLVKNKPLNDEYSDGAEPGSCPVFYLVFPFPSLILPDCSPLVMDM